MKKIFCLALLSFSLLFVLPTALTAKVQPPQLSADLAMYHKNKVFDEGKLYIGKNASRMDFMKKLHQTHVYRLDSDKIETWVHNEKMIMEMKMQYNALVNYKPEGFSENCVGEETLEGHPCQKCVQTGRFMGKNVETTVWKAKDLSGMVIKNMDAEGNGMAIKNVALGPQPESLFQAPKDYKRMTLPTGLGDLLKGMTK